MHPVPVPQSSEEIKRDFSDIVLPAALHDNVRLMAAAATNTKLHGAPFRHVLFYGAPGPPYLHRAAPHLHRTCTAINQMRHYTALR